MKHRSLFMLGAASMVPLCGCASTSTGGDVARISVRFTAPASESGLASGAGQPVDTRLVSEIQDSYGSWTPDSARFHVSLWGGSFRGEDVTFGTTSLTPGPYQFGLFDQDEDTVYQGWINVNHSSETTLDILREWLANARQQESWLGFEKKTQGKFAARDSSEFKTYQKELRRLRRLECRIESAIAAETRDCQQEDRRRENLLRHAEVLLLPSEADITRPATRAAFLADDLADARSGDAITKYILIADHDQASERLKRVNGIRRELDRTRTALSDEYDRLSKQRRLFTITGHLYDHSERFDKNQRRTSRVLQLLDRIDQQIADHYDHAVALTFVVGLATSATPKAVFAAERRFLERQRAVIHEKRSQADLRMQNTPIDSVHRVRLQRETQSLRARLENVNEQIGRVDQAVVALADLSEQTTEIHRLGTARVLAVTVLEDDLPRFLVDAVERDATLSIRLQATDSIHVPTGGEVANAAPCGRFYP